MAQELRRVAVIGGSRIPFARSNTVYTKVGNQEMLAAAIEGVVQKYGLQGEIIGEVSAGAVMKHSCDFNLVREAVLSTSLDPHTPAIDLQMACGTGLAAAINVANKIAVGQIESGIAGGSDTTSDAPIAISDGLQQVLMEANRAKKPADQLKAFSKLRPKHLIPKFPANGEPRTGKSMGQHCEMMAQTWNIPRNEQDELAVASHKNLAASYESGFQDDLIVPFQGLSKDNNMRADSSVEKLSTLKTCFDRSEKATMTPGNSTPLTDGASAVLLCSEDYAKEKGLEIQAYITFGKTAACPFVNGEEGLLMAPAYSVAHMLKDAGLTLQDFDFYEIHEAFAAQVLCTLKAWEDEEYCKTKLGADGALGSIDREKLNVNGSSLAAGHPFAATGGRIISVLAKELKEKGSGRGLISVCTAGGMGVTAIMEAA